MGRRLVGDGDRGEERWEGLTLLFGLSGEYDLSRRAIEDLRVEGQELRKLRSVCAWAEVRKALFVLGYEMPCLGGARVSEPPDRWRSLTRLAVVHPDHDGMSANLLDPAALIQAVPTKLPPAKKRLESPQDGIAVLFHTALAALGFRLIAVDENAPARTFDNSVLPDEWNQHGPSHYTFRYKHEQSSLEFVVKVVKLGSRTMINSIALEVCISSVPTVTQLMVFVERQGCYA